jgi:hypothetical protein
VGTLCHISFIKKRKGKRSNESRREEEEVLGRLFL